MPVTVLSHTVDIVDARVEPHEGLLNSPELYLTLRNVNLAWEFFCTRIDDTKTLFHSHKKGLVNCWVHDREHENGPTQTFTMMDGTTVERKGCSRYNTQALNPILQTSTLWPHDLVMPVTLWPAEGGVGRAVAITVCKAEEVLREFAPEWDIAMNGPYNFRLQS